VQIWFFELGIEDIFGLIKKITSVDYKILFKKSMVKAPVRVFIRARPTTQFAAKNISIDEEKGSILVTIPKDEAQGYVNHQQEHWQFQFSKI
jgi:hypothetical protein